MTGRNREPRRSAACDQIIIAGLGHGLEKTILHPQAPRVPALIRCFDHPVRQRHAGRRTGIDDDHGRQDHEQEQAVDPRVIEEALRAETEVEDAVLAFGRLGAGP